MTGLTKDGTRLTSCFTFPPAFIGFQGHFPEKKILPGVCQIQCALSLLEQGSGKAVVLKEVVLAKYFSPVFPDDEVTCVVNDMGDTSGETIVKAVISRKTDKISELKLRVSYDNGGSKRVACDQGIKQPILSASRECPSLLSLRSNGGSGSMRPTPWRSRGMVGIRFISRRRPRSLGRKCGLSYADYFEAGLRAPVVEFHVDYYKPLFLDEEFTITASLIWHEGSRLNIEYLVVKQDKSIASSAYMVHLFTDHQTGEPFMVSPALLERCRRRWKAGEFHTRS